MTEASYWDNAVIDDTSLLLLIAVIALLLFSGLLARRHQPTLHPLILGRQADASQVHHPGESPIYRNVNSPHGFDLAARPRRAANDVSTLLRLGAKGSEGKHRRSVYGKKVTNEEVVEGSKKFGAGLLQVIEGASGNQSALAICVEVDHIESLQALLAGELLRDATAGSTPFSTLVIPPLHLPRGQPDTFPAHGDTGKLVAVYTTAKAIRKAIQMPIATHETLYILKDEQDIAEAQKALQTNGGRLPRLMSFTEVVDHGSGFPSSTGKGEASSPQGSSIQSSFWLGSAWAQVTNQSLCAGVTAYLSFYPADKIPTTADRILVEQTPFVTSPSWYLGAAATPAGLTLALTALYTGSALQASPLTSSIDGANLDISLTLTQYKPTIIYASPYGASSLGLALTSNSKSSPLSGSLYRRKLFALRRGILNRESICDILLFNRVRKATGTDETRSLSIIGSGWTVGQTLLDILRAHLGCPVMNAFLPDGPLGVRAVRGGGGGGTLGSISMTAPISSSHSYDVQAFRANNKISEMPAHVGPPSVSVEIKVVNGSQEASEERKPHGWERFMSAGDLVGQVVVRGTLLTTTTLEEGEGIGEGWYATGQSGLFRSNGTLLLLPPSMRAEKREMVTLSTMSSTCPAKGSRKSGAESGTDEEQQAGKKGE